MADVLIGTWHQEEGAVGNRVTISKSGCHSPFNNNFKNDRIMLGLKSSFVGSTIRGFEGRVFHLERP